ncbi:MAG TPA: hypothetical protein VGR15_05020 [Bacteroidota bacterium]|nr:hypothetical protein [Bacteroidota bacterium]
MNEAQSCGKRHESGLCTSIHLLNVNIDKIFDLLPPETGRHKIYRVVLVS